MSASKSILDVMLDKAKLKASAAGQVAGAAAAGDTAAAGGDGTSVPCPLCAGAGSVDQATADTYAAEHPAGDAGLTDGSAAAGAPAPEDLLTA